MSVVSERVKNFLDQHFICYETVPHVTDYTALETSEHIHLSGKAFAKAVIVVIDHKLAMAVVPAHHHVDLNVMRSRLGARNIKLAKEWGMRHHFPDCDPGAIPPFGNLYDMPVYMSDEVAKNDAISVNAGSHEMVITLSFSDYRDLVEPIVVMDLSRPWQG